MSLAVHGERRRDKSRSRSRDRRPKDEPEREPKTYIDLQESGHGYLDDGYVDRHGDRYDNKYSKQDDVRRLPYPSESSHDITLPGSHSLYQYDDQRVSYGEKFSRPESSGLKQVPGSFPADEDNSRRGDNNDHYKIRRDPREPKYSVSDEYGYNDKRDSRYVDSKREKKDRNDASDERLRYLPQKYSQNYENHGNSQKGNLRRHDDSDDEDLMYGVPPPPGPHVSPPPTFGSYIPSSNAGGGRSSKYKDDYEERRRTQSSEIDEKLSNKSKSDPYRGYTDGSKSSSKTNVLTVDASRRTRDRSRDGRRDASAGPGLLTAEPDKHIRDRSRDGSHDRRSYKRDSSPLPPTARMSSLTVDTKRPASMSLAAAPGSPLLESYHGTYQDCSPMPSPLLLASQSVHEAPRIVEALSPLNSDGEGDGKKRSRRARFHDPEDIASRLARALKGDKPPDTEPLIEILPSLSHDQVMELRAEYKRIVKTGSERKGVNVAKHIRARLKDEDPMLMKACYSVALGMWESEAYWANFWYQGDKTRRELLIETLMGRTNEEIHYIKDAFTDKKYDNSLAKCMKTELKEDKFKKAVLTVLEERRMEDFDNYGHPVPLDHMLIERDADELRKAVKAEKGGESLMIGIVLQRSDSHLRAVLKEYEHHYRGNFAREALKKSGNLVVRRKCHARQTPYYCLTLLYRVNYSPTF